MNTRKIIGIILLAGSLFLGYMGIHKVINNDATVEILDVKLDVSNKSAKNQGYLYLGLAALLFGGGIYTIREK